MYYEQHNVGPCMQGDYHKHHAELSAAHTQRARSIWDDALELGTCMQHLG